MAWARVQSAITDSSGAGTVSVTLTGTPVAGNIIVVNGVVNAGAATSITSVQDGNSVSLTQMGAVNASGTGAFNSGAIYAYVVPATPSKTFTMAFTPTTGNGYSILAIEFSGITATADGTFGTNSSSTSPASATYSSTALNELLVTGFGDQGAGDWTLPSGYTGDANNEHSGAVNAPNAVGYKNSTNGSETNSWSWTNTDTATIVTGAFKLPGSTVFIANPGTVVGQGRLPTAMTGIAESPTVTQAVRRSGYY